MLPYWDLLICINFSLVRSFVFLQMIFVMEWKIYRPKELHTFLCNDEPVTLTVQYFLIILEMLFAQVLMEEKYG